MLRESKGNMYSFVDFTWNAIHGKCPHDCEYCYVKAFPRGELRLNRKDFKTDLGENNFIFVGSSCDVFADAIPENWILEVLGHCVKYSKNKYLFQSKNPKRIYQFKDYIPEGSIIGTTIETNRSYPNVMGNAPGVYERAYSMLGLAGVRDFKTMVTIEPILDFDLIELVALIKQCKPSWVNIGADSKYHKLPEPDKAKILDLILALEEFTEVKKKPNLSRLT